MVVALVAGFALQRFWLRELSHFTGAAEWIWVTDALGEIHPTAGLFVAALNLDGPPGEAVLKVCGDREYVVYVNGTAAACGWSRPGFRLGFFDVGHLLHQGSNTVAVEVRSPTPVGGLLLSLDVGGVGSNVLVSGPQFVFRPEFSLRPPGPEDGAIPVRWGIPPRFPWGYPRPVSHPRTLDAVVVEDAVRVTRAEAVRGEDGGTTYVLPRQVSGYLWLQFDGPGSTAVAVSPDRSGPVDRSMAAEVVRLPRQDRWLDTQPQTVQRVVVFGGCTPSLVEVLPVAPEFFDRAPGFVAGLEEGRFAVDDRASGSQE